MGLDMRRYCDSTGVSEPMAPTEGEGQREFEVVKHSVHQFKGRRVQARERRARGWGLRVRHRDRHHDSSDA